MGQIGQARALFGDRVGSPGSAVRYDLEVDPGSIPRLAAEHGLVLPG
jgi:hypothetical protein